ncbi:hypothetical protein [Parvibaculum sp.]|uniref:hypothetical protein n=1 Tax=Parvibaculum sp. TaxID=2024848 RepID=UPI001DB866FF|nr:hypothetical protein [Parvibaculum sp.]MBX3489799.1 hypothetical protein [Parvibaculum sp.]
MAKKKSARRGGPEEDVLRGALPAQVADVYDAVDAALKDHEAAKNSNFKMVFKDGWKRVQELARESPRALQLWAFIAEHAGPNGAILISQVDLAEAIGVTTRTVRALVRLLESRGALITVREAGGCIYCLNPREVWALAADQRRWAPFHTRAIFSKHSRGVLSKRLTVATFRSDAGDEAMRKLEQMAVPCR